MGEDMGWLAWVVLDLEMRAIGGEVGFSLGRRPGVIIEADLVGRGRAPWAPQPSRSGGADAAQLVEALLERLEPVRELLHLGLSPATALGPRRGAAPCMRWTPARCWTATAPSNLAQGTLACALAEGDEPLASGEPDRELGMPDEVGEDLGGLDALGRRLALATGAQRLHGRGVDRVADGPRLNGRAQVLPRAAGAPVAPRPCRAPRWAQPHQPASSSAWATSRSTRPGSRWRPRLLEGGRGRAVVGIFPVSQPRSAAAARGSR